MSNLSEMKLEEMRDDGEGLGRDGGEPVVVQLQHVELVQPVQGVRVDRWKLIAAKIQIFQLENPKRLLLSVRICELNNNRLVIIIQGQFHQPFFVQSANDWRKAFGIKDDIQFHQQNCANSITAQTYKSHNTFTLEAKAILSSNTFKLKQISRSFSIPICKVL